MTGRIEFINVYCKRLFSERYVGNQSRDVTTHPQNNMLLEVLRPSPVRGRVFPDLPLHVVIDQHRHLRPRLPPPERRSFPNPATQNFGLP